MALVQTVEPKFRVQYFLVYVLVVNNCLLDLVCCKPLEETCLTECTCREKFLMCSNLDLKEIPTTILAENVLTFDFSHNKLTCLMDFAFRNYSDLEILNLSENEIEKVYSRAFHGLAKLNNIDLSYNNLRYITPAIFSGNPALERVSFRGNQLAYFSDSPPILASLSIESLDLSHCALTSINAYTFSELPKLKFLNFNSNRLRHINWDHLKALTDLNNVDLGNNMWKCDCNIVEVLKMLSDRTKATNVDGEHKPVECFEEGEYKNISTAEIKKFCTGQAEKEGSKFLEPKSEETASQEISTFFGRKEIKINMDELECNCIPFPDVFVYAFFVLTMCIFCILWFLWKMFYDRRLQRRRNLPVSTTQNATTDKIKEGKAETIL